MTAAELSHLRQGVLARIAALTINALELQSVAYFDGPLPIYDAG